MSDEKMMPCPECPYCGKPMMAHETDWSEPPTWSFHCMCITAQGFLTREAAYAAYSVRAAHPPQASDVALSHTGLIDETHDVLALLATSQGNSDALIQRTMRLIVDLRVALAALPPVEGLEVAAQWHDQRAKDTPDAFEMELHTKSAAAIRALPLRAAAVPEGVAAEQGAECDSLNKVRQEGWREGSEFEREACAKVADNFYPHGPQLGQTIAGYIATAIRARSAAPAPQEGEHE